MRCASRATATACTAASSTRLAALQRAQLLPVARGQGSQPRPTFDSRRNALTPAIANTSSAHTSAMRRNAGGCRGCAAVIEVD